MDDPKQILENGPSKTNILTSSLEVFDFNILPERYQRKKIRLVFILPWLLFLVFLAALYPSFIMSRETQSKFKQTQFQVKVLQTSLESYQSAANEMTELQDQINFATERRDQIVSSYQGIDLQGSNWSPALFRIENSIPDNITLTSIVQQDQEILLEGIAATYQAVLDFQAGLSSLGDYAKVNIDTIEQSIINPAEFNLTNTGEDPSPTTLSPPYTFSMVGILKTESRP